MSPTMPEGLKSVKGAIDGILPDRKTSLFMALLILGLASVFLWFDKVDSTTWAGISCYILTVYVVRKIKKDQINGGGG